MPFSSTGCFIDRDLAHETIMTLATRRKQLLAEIRIQEQCETADNTLMTVTKRSAYDEMNDLIYAAMRESGLSFLEQEGRRTAERITQEVLWPNLWRDGTWGASDEEKFRSATGAASAMLWRMCDLFNLKFEGGVSAELMTQGLRMSEEAAAAIDEAGEDAPLLGLTMRPLLTAMLADETDVAAVQEMVDRLQDLIARAIDRHKGLKVAGEQIALQIEAAKPAIDEDEQARLDAQDAADKALLAKQYKELTEDEKDQRRELTALKRDEFRIRRPHSAEAYGAIELPVMLRMCITTAGMCEDNEPELYAAALCGESTLDEAEAAQVADSLRDLVRDAQLLTLDLMDFRPAGGYCDDYAHMLTVSEWGVDNKMIETARLLLNDRELLRDGDNAWREAHPEDKYGENRPADDYPAPRAGGMRMRLMDSYHHYALTQWKESGRTSRGTQNMLLERIAVPTGKENAPVRERIRALKKPIFM